MADTHDKQVTGITGGIDQDRAGLAPLHERPDRRATGRDLAEDHAERLPESLVGVLGPDAAEVTAGRSPVGEITAGRYPR